MVRLQMHSVALQVLKLRDPRLRTDEFRKKLEELFSRLLRESGWVDANASHDVLLEESQCLREIARFSYIPDAYIIDEEKTEIVTFEVEDEHPMEAVKVRDVVLLAYLSVDEFDWEVSVVTVDRYGRATELDVSFLLHAFDREDKYQRAVDKSEPGKEPARFPKPRKRERLRHTCRRCGALIAGDAFYEHRVMCAGGQRGR